MSCDFLFYEVGRLTGIKTLDDYATQFGLGQYTGIEIGGPNSAEAKGALASPEYAEANDGRVVRRSDPDRRHRPEL